MQFEEMSDRAMEIREKYTKLEEQKTGQSWSRQEIAQGFAGDVGELMKIVMAKEGRRGLKSDIDESLRHELADCLWSILVLARKYDIDLSQVFMEEMDKLEERIANE